MVGEGMANGARALGFGAVAFVAAKQGVEFKRSGGEKGEIETRKIRVQCSVFSVP